MASNFFGQIFRITTFGESHGPSIGVVIDGCPAKVPISQEEINLQLALRSPGKSPFTSPRKEPDQVVILSGIFEGQTTGAPITLLIPNEDVDSSSYEPIKNLYRPGHANFTYLQKYGIFDHRGGGRASARETAARVAAGAIAKKLLLLFQIDCVAFVHSIGNVTIDPLDIADLREKTYQSPIFCPCEKKANQMIQLLKSIKEEKDSIGGVIGCIANVPPGLGDPIYSKLEAQLAFAMLSIPASKGFEIGAGFDASSMKGSEHNDLFEKNEKGDIRTKTNFSGGVLGGISTGSPLFFKTAFKPTSSIKKPQETVNVKGEKAQLELGSTARHDPCVAIRAVPIVEAMTALVLADALLMQQVAQLQPLLLKN
jgi:chorismate synthase